jgi:FMN phosphatase YigB (HAD superfamily)
MICIPCRPDQNNFKYALNHLTTIHGVPKDKVLAVAQSLYHDHVPARALGISSTWIARATASVGLSGDGVPASEEGKKRLYTWQFATLGEFADAMEAARGS